MAPAEANPAKRKLTLLSDSDSDSDSDDGGASLQVNEEYARRFEHNKKREEKQRLEEKYKNDNEDSEDDESSSDETEDEAGFLATEALDAKMTGMLNALRSKDPSVYDKSKKFFTEEDLEQAEQQKEGKKEKPVTLQDYHRKNFMEGYTGEDEDAEQVPQTYDQQQAAMKRSIVDAMHADASDSDSDSDDGLGIKRKEPAKVDSNGVHPSRSKAIEKKPNLDVEGAERDPETFLSNFMASRAWVPEEGGKWEAFESDDGEGEDEMADDWEQAYNMRFEDPAKSNEVLKSYSRDLANSRSVRREDKSGRKRRRDAEKEKKEAEKAQRREEKARLKKLRIDDAEEKLKKLRQAAGAVGVELNEEDWVKFLDDAYDNDKWEEEMNKRFGEEYYAVQDEGLEDEEGEGGKKGLKKPKWDDDIDINDIVPDFDDGKVEVAEDDEQEDDDEDGPPAKKRKSSDHKRARLDTQKKARADHAKVEALIDSKLNLDHHPLLSSSSGFKYRETEPQSFGMTARDILLAPSDSALNDYAGLKKLAHWRDQEKKAMDAQRLSKKKRLRKWRRDNFGSEFEKSGPTYGFERFADEHQDADAPAEGSRVLDVDDGGDGNIVEGARKKKKRSKGKKKGSAEVEA